MKKNNLNTIHTSSSFYAFLELNLDCVHITFFLFLLKLPMIDKELLPY